MDKLLSKRFNDLVHSNECVLLVKEIVQNRKKHGVSIRDTVGARTMKTILKEYATSDNKYLNQLASESFQQMDLIKSLRYSENEISSLVRTAKPVVLDSISLSKVIFPVIRGCDSQRLSVETLNVANAFPVHYQLSEPNIVSHMLDALQIHSSVFVVQRSFNLNPHEKIDTSLDLLLKLDSQVVNHLISIGSNKYDLRSIVAGIYNELSIHRESHIVDLNQFSQICRLIHILNDDSLQELLNHRGIMWGICKVVRIEEAYKSKNSYNEAVSKLVDLIQARDLPNSERLVKRLNNTAKKEVRYHKQDLQEAYKSRIVVDPIETLMYSSMR